MISLVCVDYSRCPLSINSAAHWPYVPADDPIGPLFDRITKFVATRKTDMKLDWQNSRTLGNDAIGMVSKLKKEEGPDLLTQGSSDFLRSLFRSDLVDEVNIMTVPVLLGHGKRLFADGVAAAAWRLCSSKASQKGVVLNKYVRIGDITTGSFEFEQPTEAELKRRANLR